jgi:THO complex subunit 3
LTLIRKNAKKSDNIFILSPTQPTPIASHQQSVQTNQISFCWSGEKVFVTTAHGRTRILSYPDFEPIMRLAYDNGDGDGSDEFMLDGHTSSCLSAELQPNGRYLATGGSDSIIALWDTQEWICQRTLTSMVGPVRSISMLIALPSCLFATGPPVI